VSDSPAEDPYELRKTSTVRRALSETLPETVATAAYEFITAPLLADPHRIGKRLLPPMDDRFSARRGTYLVIYRIDDKAHVVTVVDVAHPATLTAPKRERISRAAELPLAFLIKATARHARPSHCTCAGCLWSGDARRQTGRLANWQSNLGMHVSGGTLSRIHDGAELLTPGPRPSGWSHQVRGFFLRVRADGQDFPPVQGPRQGVVDYGQLPGKAARQEPEQKQR
jgi:mRNA-degrading endonuclease RelE of RelBE toxin-antitoxin system